MNPHAMPTPNKTARDKLQAARLVQKGRCRQKGASPVGTSVTEEAKMRRLHRSTHSRIERKHSRHSLSFSEDELFSGTHGDTKMRAPAAHAAVYE
jgi:hypothetical protein